MNFWKILFVGRNGVIQSLRLVADFVFYIGVLLIV